MHAYKFRKVLAIAIAGLLLLTSPADTAICSHFVDNSVNRDGDGSRTHPWDNIAGHVNDLAPGDTMCVRGDPSAPGRVYTEPVISLAGSASGTEEAPITVHTYPGEHVVIIPNAEYALFILNITQVDYWEFDGFVFDGEFRRGYIIGIDTADRNIMRNCEVRRAKWSGIQFDSGDHNLIENCEIHDFDRGPHLDANGIVFAGGHHNVIRSNTIYDARGDCISTYELHNPTSGTIIEDNDLYTTLGSCCENALDLKALAPDSAPVIIRNNTMHGFRYCDGSCGGSGGGAGHAILIQNTAGNVIIDSNEIYDSTSGIRVQGRNVKVVNNLIHDLATEPEVWGNMGIQLPSSTNVHILNNTLVNIPREALWISGGHNDLQIRNNLFYNTGQAVVEEDVTGLAVDYNGWFNAAERIAGPHDVVGDDSLFFAPGDYHLRATSPAVDAGTDVGVTTDFENDLRPFGSGFDIGADEYVPVFVYLPVILRTYSK